MCKWLMAAAMVLVLAGEARSFQWMSGNQLHGLCSSEKLWENAFCSGYVLGISVAADGNILWGRRACIPDEVYTTQVHDVTTLWLEQHPADRHHEAYLLVAQALAEAFPCE